MNRAAVLMSAMVLAACTDPGETEVPQPQMPIGPISALQVGDLLSPDAGGKDGNLFVTAEPERCSGVARESEPPFLKASEAVADDGGHWVTAGSGDTKVYVEEMVAVYRADFDPRAALAAARGTVTASRGTTVTVTSARGGTYLFDVVPAAQADPATTVLWSLRSPGWDCDNALVAMQNVAVEITGCGERGGFDIAAAAEEAVERITTLANTNA